MSPGDLVREELDEHASVVEAVRSELSDEIDALGSLVDSTLASGGKLLLCGNGGSAADAQHVAAEYVVRFARDRAALPAIALTTDTSVLSAAANDLGFARIFERQVETLAKEGDLLVLHSTSGESENLLRAAAKARELGVRSVALLAGGGGRLRDAVDVALVVPTDSTARAQEMHLLIQHIVCEHVDRRSGDTNDQRGDA